MMDEMEKMEFNILISNCEMHVLSEGLATEITEILKRNVYDSRYSKQNKKKLIQNNCCMHYRTLLLLIQKTKIQIPKQYFKKMCVICLEQTELSNQFDVNAIMSNISAEGG